MIDRLVHHAEVVALKGDSYRLKDRDLGRVPPDAIGTAAPFAEVGGVGIGRAALAGIATNPRRSRRTAYQG